MLDHKKLNQCQNIQSRTATLHLIWMFYTVSFCSHLEFSHRWRHTGDGTVGSSTVDLRNRIICTDRMSVELYYGANFKWHMPIWEEICRAEQKYMRFFGTVAEPVIWKKNPQHRNIYKSSQCCALDFVSENGPTFWIFVSRIHR